MTWNPFGDRAVGVFRVDFNVRLLYAHTVSRTSNLELESRIDRFIVRVPVSCSYSKQTVVVIADRNKRNSESLLPNNLLDGSQGKVSSNSYGSDIEASPKLSWSSRLRMHFTIVVPC